MDIVLSPEREAHPKVSQQIRLMMHNGRPGELGLPALRHVMRASGQGQEAALKDSMLEKHVLNYPKPLLQLKLKLVTKFVVL